MEQNIETAYQRVAKLEKAGDAFGRLSIKQGLIITLIGAAILSTGAFDQLPLAALALLALAVPATIGLFTVPLLFKAVAAANTLVDAGWLTLKPLFKRFSIIKPSTLPPPLARLVDINLAARLLPVPASLHLT